MTHHFELSEKENHCFGCGDNPWELNLIFNLQKHGWVVVETLVRLVLKNLWEQFTVELCNAY